MLRYINSCFNYLISALFLTHLTIPSQFLETFGFYPIGNGLRGEESGLLLWHTRHSFYSTQTSKKIQIKSNQSILNLEPWTLSQAVWIPIAAQWSFVSLCRLTIVIQYNPGSAYHNIGVSSVPFSFLLKASLRPMTDWHGYTGRIEASAPAEQTI